MNTSYLATLHYHTIRRLLVHRCLSLYALLMLTVSVLLLSHSAPALAADPPAFAFVVNYRSSTVSRNRLGLNFLAGMRSTVQAQSIYHSMALPS